MPTTDLGACEWFAWDLRRSNLIARDRLDALLADFLKAHPAAEPPVLADWLVARGFLTAFQAGRLLQGKTEGFVLGAFTLVDALGAGSMGAVYKAHSKTDGKFYAVKVLPRRSMWNMRLARRKVRAFEDCRHPAVVPFADAGTSGGMHYLAWPLVEGESLDRLVERRGGKETSPLPAAQAADVGVQAAEGLDACHRQGLFHGLLKPSNLMLESDGRLRILDLGIGALLAETSDESLVDTMSTANSVSSGLDCASPESILDPSKLAPVGDQYGLGCVLYYCLTGRYPFPGGTAVDKMVCHQHRQPTPLKELAPDAPDGLVAAVERLMQKAPADRYASAAEAADALRPFAPEKRTRGQGDKGTRGQGDKGTRGIDNVPLGEAGRGPKPSVAASSPLFPLSPCPPVRPAAAAPPEPRWRQRMRTVGVALRAVAIAVALGAAGVVLCLLMVAWLTYLF